MLTKMTGVLTRVLDDEVRLTVGPFEYQVLVPEAVRRQMQMKAGQELTLHISEYLEGNQGGNRFVPRRVGFNTEAELDFFDLFCTVEKIGVKKALKAMARPIREIADAIHRGDTKWLSTLPGIGPTTAEQIVATLKRKMPPFLTGLTANPAAEPEPTISGKKPKKPTSEPTPTEPLPNEKLIDEVYQALMALGHTPIEARTKLDALLSSNKRFTTVEEGVRFVYLRG